MSTSYTERSSSERIIRSVDVAGLQITPKPKHRLRLCVMKRLDLARRRIYREERPAATPQEGQDSGAPRGSGLCVPGGLFLGGGGRGNLLAVRARR